MRQIQIHDYENNISGKFSLEEDEYLEVWPFQNEEGEKMMVVERRKSPYGKAPFVMQENNLTTNT